jgi:NTP pyrophosphatase (non-canonical NTP hydrolase)
MQNYIEEALRTESPITPELVDRLTGNARAVHAFFGLLTEMGELADGFKRAIFYGKSLDTTNIKEEVGDVLWYLAILMDTLGIDFEQCMEANIAKLRNRYPEKYSHESALNRDLTAERQILETKLEECLLATGLPAIGDPYQRTDQGWAEPAEEKELKEPLCCYYCGRNTLRDGYCVNPTCNSPKRVESDIPTLKAKPLGHSYTRYCTHCKIKPIHKTNELGICTDCFMKHGEPKEVGVDNGR